MGPSMTHFYKALKDGRFTVELEINSIGPDIDLTLTGGTHPHIGAITQGASMAQTYERPHHKEGPLSLWIWEQFRKTTSGYLLVKVGLHVDNANQEDIQRLVENTKELIHTSLKELHFQRETPNKT